MPDLIVLGQDVLANPFVGTNSTGGTLNNGTATVQSGTKVFEDDDVIVFDVVGLDPNGEVIPGTGLADITVYDNYQDYLAGITKYNYSPQNPGQTANAQTDISGNGDPYVRFVSTDIMQPIDGGPRFAQLFIAPNSNIANRVPAGEEVAFDRNASYDFNEDGDSIDPPVEVGNNRFFVGNYLTPVICFAAGTMIRTPDGEKPIEDLVPGSRVVTLDHGVQIVRWVGTSKVPAAGALAPISFAPGVAGNTRALLVSPNHRILWRNSTFQLYFGSSQALVAAKFLVGVPGVTRKEGGSIVYVHIQFDHHEIIWANDILAESLCPLNRDDPTAAEAAGLHELSLIFPKSDMQDMRNTRLTARPVLKSRETLLLRDPLQKE